MKLLLHICCGPCAIAPIRRLQEAGVEVTGLFVNPNIHPLMEYKRRRDGTAQVAARLGVRVLFKDDEYRPQDWFRAVAQREDNRCHYCYHMRLERTAQIARRGGFDAFSTTLLYSRFQKHAAIAALGRDLAAGGGPAFHYEDWRAGWTEGIEASKAWGVYRQQYCGCLYSENERYRAELDSPPPGAAAPGPQPEGAAPGNAPAAPPAPEPGP
ncbi:epoxyqueuosine reductase QueH [Desulfocurvus vexinensis]|uniref:epoxyqueuosine reductase QueH n=1 Tax=Desulfocurvus vexinensis TaxID=399548 RepID=UPI0004B7FDFE